MLLFVKYELNIYGFGFFFIFCFMAYKWHNSTDSCQEWEYKIMQKKKGGLDW